MLPLVVSLPLIKKVVSMEHSKSLEYKDRLLLENFGPFIWKKVSYEKKFDAYRLVADAVRTGKIERQPCVACGKSKVQAHHEDYSKPLDIVWYCQKHHSERHREIRKRLDQLEGI